MIINRYTATGQKLSSDYLTKVVPAVTPVGNSLMMYGLTPSYEGYGTEYAGNIEYSTILPQAYYDNLTKIYDLCRVHNAEGYVDYNVPEPLFEGNIRDLTRYNYYRRDHLGNNRELWTPSYYINKTYGGYQTVAASTRQRVQYYPSGLPWYETENFGEQPYMFGGKEFIEAHGYDEFDFEARGMRPATMRFDGVDPLCEKYPGVSPYAYCGNNPINYIDPDGRDAMLAGSGTKEDPYVITATYYYQNGSLNEAQLKGLNDAVSTYNKSGKNGVTEIKNADGSKSYVSYNLSAQGVDDVQAARMGTAFETTSGETQYYGNIVGTKPNTGGSGDEFGSAHNYEVNFNVANINAGIAGGMNSSSLNKGVAIHEIGHNLGGEHSDGTSVMSIIQTTTTHNQIGGTTTTSHSYPSMSTKFTPIIFNRRDTPRPLGSGEGRIWTKKP